MYDCQRREVGDAADRDHGRRPRNLGRSPWAARKKVLAEQGDDRLRRLDHGARADNDATLPILADGIKWLGYVPKAHILWNLGLLRRRGLGRAVVLDLREPVSGRFAWVRFSRPTAAPAAHRRQPPLRQGQRRQPAAAGASGCLGGAVLHGHRRFAASSTDDGDRDLLPAGTRSPSAASLLRERQCAGVGRPVSFTAASLRSWLMTGEVRTYNTRGGYFNQISPATPVFSGGLAPGSSWRRSLYRSRRQAIQAANSGG